MDNSELQNLIEQMMLKKKAEEAQKAEEEADDLHDYMEQDSAEHTQQALTQDSDGKTVPRFKRIIKGIPS